MTPLMKLGHQKFLTMDDLWNLDPQYRSKKISEDFDVAWNKELKKKKLLSFLLYLYISIFNIFLFLLLLFFIFFY